jgi:hypothetical protein
MPTRCLVSVRLRNDEVDGHLVVGIRYVSPSNKNAAIFKTPGAYRSNMVLAQNVLVLNLHIIIAGFRSNA